MTENPGGEVITVEKLQEQIANLNKGIATYRGESQASKAEVAAAIAKVAELEAVINAAKETDDDDKNKEVNLNPKDQEKLDAWAKSQGFVTKAEMEAQKAEIYNASMKTVETQAVEEFLKTYPVYDKDEEWAKVMEQFALYKTPTSLAGYQKLLNKIHKELNPGDDGSARTRAEIETRKRLGLGGGSQKTGTEEGVETIESLQEKYPRLNRAQIESRLAELKALYPDKK